MRQSQIRFILMQIKGFVLEARELYDKSELPENEQTDDLGRALDSSLMACDSAMLGKTFSEKASNK